MKRTVKAIFGGVGTQQIGVMFPALPGCVTVASSIEEAHARAREVLAFHVQSMVDDHDPIPETHDEAVMREMLADFEEDGGEVMVVEVPLDVEIGEPVSG